MGTKYKGENVREPEHRSPYPLSRLAPSMELVELAREIRDADDALALQATAQLRLLAEQIGQLQAEAGKILAETRKNQQLHRAECGFSKRAGQRYHLYRRKNGRLVLSLVAPGEWSAAPPFEFIGTYRLESDKTWKEETPDGS